MSKPCVLSLSNWPYNVERIKNELKNIFENKGGMVVSRWYCSHDSYFKNRSLEESIRGLERKIKYLDEAYAKQGRTVKPAAYYDYCRELERLKLIPNEPILMSNAQEFVLGGKYYGLIFNDNMFFDTDYLVADFNESEFLVDYDYYRILPDDGWKFDCLIRNDCTQKDISEVANQLFNILVNTHPIPKRSNYNKNEYKMFKLHRVIYPGEKRSSDKAQVL